MPNSSDWPYPNVKQVAWSPGIEILAVALKPSDLLRKTISYGTYLSRWEDRLTWMLRNLNVKDPQDRKQVERAWGRAWALAGTNETVTLDWDKIGNPLLSLDNLWEMQAAMERNGLDDRKFPMSVQDGLLDPLELQVFQEPTFFLEQLLAQPVWD